MSADAALQRAHAYLEDARDPSIDPQARCEALDASRGALLDARRARAQSDLLLPIFNEICSAAINDPAAVVRYIVPRTVEDLCLREMKTFIPASTALLARSLHDDDVLVAKRAVRALTTLFRRLIGYIVSVGISEDTFPEPRLSAWLQMQTKAISLVHAQDEGLRKAAVKFAETVVLAFSYSGGPGSSDHFTLDYILKKGSTCPLLNASSLEEEGVRCVKALAQYVHSALDGSLTSIRPDGSSAMGLPPLSFMTAISVFSNLVRRRRKLLQFTLPPLLLIVAAISGSTRPPSPAFHSLSEGQKQSIVSVLRFSILALRAYPHTRAGRAGNDINLATSDLGTYEKEHENMRRERAAASAVEGKRQKVAATPTVAGGREQLNSLPVLQKQPAQQPRPPREEDSGRPWPRPPAKEAFTLAQNLIRSMPHQEVVNFILTRLMFNIPPTETVPGAVRPRPPRPHSTKTDEPPSKRPRRSRFATNESEDPNAPSAPPKKVVTVRKVAPPVVAARLSTDAIEQLVTLCCRRVMKRESEALISGAGPLRIQLLARLLTILTKSESNVARKFCDEACAFIADNVEERLELALAWLHCLLFSENFSAAPHAANGDGTEEELMEDRDQKSSAIKEDSSLSKSSRANGDVEADGSQSTPSDEGNQGEAKTELSTVKESNVEGTPPAEDHDEATTVGFAEQSKMEIDEEDSEEELNLAELSGEEYESTLTKLIILLKERADTSPEAFSRMITEAPVLPAGVLEVLNTLCKDPSRSKLGLQTLRDVTAERSGDDRKKCLMMLLNYACDRDEVLRGPAIRLVANNIFADCSEEVSQFVQNHAVESLEKAITSLSEPPSEESIDLFDRSSLLLTALCGQQHSLLVRLVSIYARSPAVGRNVLLPRAKDLAGNLGMSAKPVLDLISGNLMKQHRGGTEALPESDGTEDFAMEVLQALLKKFGKPTPDVVEAACARYEAEKDANFLIAVLGGLRRDALLHHLGAIVEASAGTSEDGNGNKQTETSQTEAGNMRDTGDFKSVVSQIMNARPPALSPAELLVELHKIAPSAAANTAIHGCFEVKVIYKQGAVAQAIQQLLEMTTTPDLFMDTVHLARIFHPELEKYLTDTVMKRLIEKKVWKNELMWEGYLRYCAEIKEKSLKLLLSLPAPQLEDALEKQPALVTVFKDLVSNPKSAKKVPAKHKKVISAAIRRSSKVKR